MLQEQVLRNTNPSLHANDAIAWSLYPELSVLLESYSRDPWRRVGADSAHQGHNGP